MNTTVSKVNNYTYKLKINPDVYGDYQYRNVLYETVLKIVPHGFYNSHNYETDDLHIYFTCETLKTFEQYMTENEDVISCDETIKIIHSLSIQINYLFEKKYGFYGIDKNDILVLNNSQFIIICPNKLCPIEENCIKIYKPLHANINIYSFDNPEIKNIHKHVSYSSPEFINHKCIYYSIGLIVIYCAFGLTEINDVEEDLNIIHSTKLYYFLERCFDENVNDRYLLFI